MEENIERSLELAHSIVDTLEEKKGEDIVLLDLLGVCTFADYFIICTGTSDRMLRALSQDVQKRLKTEGSMLPQNVEGDAHTGWILMDYGDVILHLFSPLRREFYQLEELWKDGKTLLRIQ